MWTTMFKRFAGTWQTQESSSSISRDWALEYDVNRFTLVNSKNKTIAGKANHVHEANPTQRIPQNQSSVILQHPQQGSWWVCSVGIELQQFHFIRLVILGGHDHRQIEPWSNKNVRSESKGLRKGDRRHVAPFQVKSRKFNMASPKLQSRIANTTCNPHGIGGFRLDPMGVSFKLGQILAGYFPIGQARISSNGG